MEFRRSTGESVVHQIGFWRISKPVNKVPATLCFRSRLAQGCSYPWASLFLLDMTASANAICNCGIYVLMDIAALMFSVYIARA
jgi:hypothetical protein